nr:hypothetical protein [Tanacetum cinerariifolium]
FVCNKYGAWFFESEGGEGGRGVKEKSVYATNLEVVKDDVVPSVTVAYGNTQKDLNDDPVAMEVQSPSVDLTNAVKTGGDHTHHYLLRELLLLETPLSRSELLAKDLQILLMASSWVSEWLTPLLLIMLGTLGNSDVDFMKEDVGNVPVWVKLHGVPITAFSKDGLSVIATKLGSPLMLDSYTSDMCLQSWGKLSYARVMIDLRANVDLEDTIVVAMPKTIGEGYYTCTIRVEYEWKPPRCSCCFKPHKEFRHAPKMPTASSTGNKKKGVEPTNEFEDVLIDGQAILVDENGNPLKKVKYSGDYDREYEVASVDNDMAHSIASEKVCFGTQSLLEQWRDSNGNVDYDEDPYDDDMCEG